MEERINLSHGSGFKASRDIVENIIKRHLGNKYLDPLYDSALLDVSRQRIAFTTDSYTVSPIFFPGSDIGKLSVYGTVNDLSVMGATPEYLSLGIILEEGFSFKDFERIVLSIKEAKEAAGVEVVCGDLKVVPAGKVDGIFINTSGLGVYNDCKVTGRVEKGDVFIVNGSLGEHEIAVLLSRGEFDITADIKSDCAPLNKIIHRILSECQGVKFMRDLTRGGLGVVLNEISDSEKVRIKVEEKKLLLKKEVKSICELWGYDPLYLANEGKFVMVVSPDDKERVMNILKKENYTSASVIGEVVSAGVENPEVVIDTTLGGKRMLDYPYLGQYPRIC